MMTFAEHVLKFYKSLDLSAHQLPEGVEVLNPYQDKTAFDLTQKFFNKFYNDSNPRKLIIGINPGRFGGGMTGIPFTDPIRLERICGIENDLPKKPELSADFMYQMIEAYGGAEKFYRSYFISSVSPLGFTKDGKNLNYYDVKELQFALQKFIVQSIRTQLTFNISSDVAFCLGEGQNYKFLQALNKEHNFFGEIIPLPHPRFIMQYRRKRLGEFVERYMKVLGR
ncbi:MAG TPA: uracil-DNA glycosylase family protein [Cyclobacteriaceae bacterium]|nr:uracil-DNA glycosylase family protein [Cyclobacteriaceae bacterium]